MNLIALAKENKTVVLAAVAVVGLLGGTAVVELPADRKIKKMEAEVAQTFQQQQQWQSQQNLYHRQQEIQAIQWQMQWITNEVNRINLIPQYLERPITPQEAWQVEQWKQDWVLLKQRLQQLQSQR